MLEGGAAREIREKFRALPSAHDLHKPCFARCKHARTHTRARHATRAATPRTHARARARTHARARAHTHAARAQALALAHYRTAHNHRLIRNSGVRAQFTKEEHIRTSAPVRSSDQRQIKATILQQFPALEEYIEEIMPKKDSLIMCKCKDNIQVLVGPAPDNEFIFFQCRQGPWLPTLRLLHQYPDILPKFRVDRGAIRFVLSGANIMAPGLTSPGGHMDPVPAESLVGIFAEGKEHALAIGVTTMSSEQIAGDNKGIAVENTHWLKDGMWTLRSLAP